MYRLTYIGQKGEKIWSRQMFFTSAMTLIVDQETLFNINIHYLIKGTLWLWYEPHLTQKKKM